MKTTLNDSELSILNKSLDQLTHSITTAHLTQSSHLLTKSARAQAAEPPPSGTPPTTNLNDILNNAVKAPGTTSIATVPNTPDSTMLQMLSQVQTLDSYISLLTGFCVYNERPTPYDITKPKEASLFTQAEAKWRNYVITGGAVKAMTGYLPIGTITSQSFSKEVVSADLHLEFLTELFGSFSLPDAAKQQLDGILSKVFEKLGKLNLSFETQSSTLDHFITYYYFSTVAGTGGTTDIPAMYVPNVRTFYLKITQESWKVTVGKSSASKLKFNMNYFDMTTKMNPGLVANDMTAINGAIQKLTSHTADEINKLMNMQAISADPQKA